MDIEHSRLLKFFINDKPKMEKHSLKIEVLAPTDIESEVPRQQQFREATVPTEPPSRNETSVQKDQPIEWINLRDMIKKPVYMGIQDAVITTPHPIRDPRAEAPTVEDPVSRIEDHAAKEDKPSPEDKPQTRIPVSRFKPAVERVQRERREARGANEKSKREAPEKPRRSSIPKLRDRVSVTRKNPTDEDPSPKAEREPVNTANDETPLKTIERKPIRRDRIPIMRKDHYKIVKKEDNVKSPEQTSVNDKQEESVKTDPNEKLDDEFDKLYEEIVDTDAGSLPDEILETKVKDPEKLESKFEEIVHQYDDETVEQVKIEPVDKARYSKIPLLRRRSSQDIKIPKHGDRKLALKIGDKSVKGEKTINTKNASINSDGKSNGVVEDDKIEPSEDIDTPTAQEDSLAINNNNEQHIAAQSPNPIPDYNTIPTPESERVKVGIFGMATREIPIDDNTNQNIDVTTPVLETVQLAVVDIPAEESLKSINTYAETEDGNRPSNNKEKQILINEIQKETFKSLDEHELVEADDVKKGVEINNGVKDQNEIIKIPIINDDIPAQLEENHVDEPQKDIVTRKPDVEFKSVSLLQKANTVEERTKSRYINKPVDKENYSNNITAVEEEIPTVKGKVSRILKRLTSREHSNNDSSEDTDIDVKKEEINTKKQVEDMPMKKSVLSKIAMFERTEPVPPSVQKPVPRYSKPKRTISEEIKHSPKIVQEVLKPKGAEQTDKYTIVTIDIKRPVEIITNNVEQVTVVENLKEKDIEFEIFDDNKLNSAEPANEEQVTIVENLKDKTESVEIKLREQSVSNQKISIDDSRLYVAEPRESKGFRKISETRDKILEDDVATETQKINSDSKPKELSIPYQTISRKDNSLNETKDRGKISVTKDLILDDVNAPISSYVDSDDKPNKHTIVSDNKLYAEPKKSKDARKISVTRHQILEDDINTVPKYLSKPDKNSINDQNGSTEILRDGAVETIIPKYVKSSENELDEIYNNYKKSRFRIYEPGNNNAREHNKDLNDDHYYERNNIESIKTELYNGDKINKWKSTDALADFVPVKEKINRLTSYEETNMKKAKSTAELDLGDAVKGKVKNMIGRMNSFDLLDDIKVKDVEVINVKERPRKRSVSEKIALFERKLTPVAMENVQVDKGRSLNVVDPKPPKNDANAIPQNGAKIHGDKVSNTVGNMDEYAAKIQELQNAKKFYGSVGMNYIELRDGRKMPVLAVGTALLDPRLAKHIVAAAIDLGYRAFDTAYIYGTEREVGEGIRMKIQDGTVKREELFIMNKLWSTFHRPDLVEGACRASLAALGLDYFDLFMIHNPMSFKEGGDPIPKIANVLQFSSFDYLDAWFAMEDLVTEGLVRSVGVSNFNSVQLTRVLEKGRIKPAVNQVECHPYLTQKQLSEFCEARDVRLSCYGVLGSKGTPAELKNSTWAAIDDAAVQMMATGLNITPAQLLIRYQIDSGRNVVVKASSAAHLWDNLQALGVYLRPVELHGLDKLNRNRRTFVFKGMGDTHKNYPFTIAF